MKIIAIIPARISSTRLPEKPLALIGKKTLIQWVYENVSKSKLIDKVIVATDSDKIAESVHSFGGNFEMTSPDHQSGTDRIAEVAIKLDGDIILNVQGDEPFITSDVIDTVLKIMVKDDKIYYASAKTSMSSVKEFFNSNIVKVICDDKDFAIYFSRAPIPYFREEFDSYKKNGKIDSSMEKYILSKAFKHIGIYAYKWDFLLKFTKMKESFLEKTEKLEQLRAIENGYKIIVPTVKYNGFGIDTYDDLERARKILRG
ncbi:MAG: 3-deoxy-manno-octulosonate cytidylyltransferase [Proteobacteria bacterium]|nr:3-deoxy-manno-octulosonate cytidylyltransferase [Pseudomonadota bacterium]